MEIPDCGIIIKHHYIICLCGMAVSIEIGSHFAMSSFIADRQRFFVRDKVEFVGMSGEILGSGMVTYKSPGVDPESRTFKLTPYREER